MAASRASAVAFSGAGEGGVALRAADEADAGEAPAGAERLLLLIFERFDRNEDLCIQAEEFKDAIDGILQKKMLDDRYFAFIP